MWQFILTDLQGSPWGELTGADNRSVSDLWMRMGTASCTIPLWHPMANAVMDPAADTMLQCYRTDDGTGTKTLVFNGPVMGAEETGSAGSQHVAISAVSPLIRLQKRLLDVNKAGIEWTNIDLSQNRQEHRGHGQRPWRHWHLDQHRSWRDLRELGNPSIDREVDSQARRRGSERDRQWGY